MSRKKQIILGSIISYASIVINIVAGLVYTPWMIKQIGQSDYGLYTLAYSLINLFLLDFGLSSAAARYISVYRAEGNQEKVDAFLGTIYKLFLFVDLIIFGVLLSLFFFINNIYANLTPQEIEKFKVIYVIASFYSVLSFPFVITNGVLTAYEKIIQLKLADIIYRVLVVSLTIIALIQGWGLYSLVAVNAISGLIVIVFKILVIRLFTPARTKFSNKNSKGILKEIFKYSLWITIASIAQRLVFNITPSILGIVSGSHSISLFGIVVTIEAYVYTIATAINGIFMSKIARIYTNAEDGQDILPLLTKVGRFQFGINLLIAIGFICVGREFIAVWVGDEYIDSYFGIILVIIPGLFFNSLQIAHTAIMVKNRVRITAIVNIIMGVLNVALSFPLSYFFGMFGACVAIFFSYIVRMILLYIIYPKVLSFNLLTFVKKCYLTFIIPALITFGFGLALNYSISGTGWLWLFIKGTIIVFVFLVSVYLFGLASEEKSVVSNKLNLSMLWNGNQTSKEENKISKCFYILRFFAIISVMFAHCATYNSVFLQRISGLLGLIGVPCFMICSGYFLNPNEKAFSFWKKKVLHVIIPWLFYGSLTYALSAFLSKDGFSIKAMGLWIIGYGTWLYYIPVYLVISFVFRITKYVKSSIAPLFLIGVSAVVNILIVSNAIPFSNLTTYLNPFSFIVFFGLGFTIRRFNLVAKFYDKNIIPIFAFSLFLLCFLKALFDTDAITYWQWYSMVFEISAFIVLFYLAKYLSSRFLIYSGKRSLLFYFLHMRIGVGVANKLLGRLLFFEPALFFVKPIVVFGITITLIVLIDAITNFKWLRRIRFILGL